MTIVDDRNFTFADVQLEQGCTFNGSFIIRVNPSEDGRNAYREGGVLIQVPDNAPVSDICNVEIHKKRLA